MVPHNLAQTCPDNLDLSNPHNLAHNTSPTPTCLDNLDTVTLESLDQVPLATWLENNPGLNNLDPNPTTVPRNLAHNTVLDLPDLATYLLVDNPACLEEQVPPPLALVFLGPPQDPVQPATWLANNLDLNKLALGLHNPDLNKLAGVPLLVDNRTRICPEVPLELVALRLANQLSAVRSVT